MCIFSHVRCSSVLLLILTKIGTNGQALSTFGRLIGIDPAYMLTFYSACQSAMIHLHPLPKKGLGFAGVHKMCTLTFVNVHEIRILGFKRNSLPNFNNRRTALAAILRTGSPTLLTNIERRT